jgi:hypothetical protein
MVATRSGRSLAPDVLEEPLKPAKVAKTAKAPSRRASIAPAAAEREAEATAAELKRASRRPSKQQGQGAEADAK